MINRWRLFVGALVMALASASTYGQAKSQPVGGVEEYRPATLRLRSTRRPGTWSPPSVYRARPTTVPVFSVSKRPEASDRSAFVLVQSPSTDLSWTQWGKNPQHTGEIDVKAQSFNAQLADIIYDPNVPEEKADPLAGGNLLVHYQTPLTDGDDVFMEFKGGNFTQIQHWETQTWSQKRLHWENGQLVEKWTFQSDWKPVPFASNITFNGPFWEPVYHAVLVGDFVYDPGFGGTIFKLRRSDGSVVARINPFGNTIDAQTFVAGPLSADSAGNVYYNAIKLTQGKPWDKDVVNSWLVKVAPDGTVTKATYASLTPGAPAATDQCKVGFGSPPPWPPSPTAVAPTAPCGSQRPGINVAPAIAPDGTIYTVSRAHFVTRYNFLIAVNPDLTVKWAASLRNRLNDGCNVTIPPNGTPGGCRVGATTGVAPDTNEPPPARVLDDSSSSPVVLPDGSVLYGAYTRYNYAQGHLMKFSSTGQFLAAFPFGWDVTPGVFNQGTNYSIVIKDNHYGGVGSYCNDPVVCSPDRTASNPGDPEAYFITQLNANLEVEWKFQHTNTLSCSRDENGVITCVDDHPNGFEWCVNAFGIDKQGRVYANSEDGNLFAIKQGGTLDQKRFLKLALGAAYTPMTIGPDGKIYAQNDGHLFVIGDAPLVARDGWGVFKQGLAGK
ncbi:MAG TPA: hypothetical protein VJH03_00360 [Blastocatellia bacterium]|nr:hypothetical protein [Blastocatellia bacterium]